MHTSQSYHPHPSALLRTNRIVWRLPVYGDTRMNAARAQPLCDAEDFGRYLCFFWNHMFSPNDKTAIPRQTIYTPKSFAALFAFLRGRVTTPDWAKCLDVVIDISRSQRVIAKLVDSVADEAIQATISLAAPQNPRRLHCPTHHNGILKLQPPLSLGVLVITVPRSKLRPIFGKFMSHGRHVPTSFQIYGGKIFMDRLFFSQFRVSLAR
jgi:hypothetical protein